MFEGVIFFRDQILILFSKIAKNDEKKKSPFFCRSNLNLKPMFQTIPFLFYPEMDESKQVGGDGAALIGGEISAPGGGQKRTRGARLQKKRGKFCCGC